MKRRAKGIGPMPVNRDKTHLWKADTAASVDFFNKWFMESAPKAFRETRIIATRDVESTLQQTRDFSKITPELLREKPEILPTLRMACCPPLAVDRLIGLSGAGKGVVKRLEKGKLPLRLSDGELTDELDRLIGTIDRLLDRDIFPWLADGKKPTPEARHRAATVIADRLCASKADEILRHAEWDRQFGTLNAYLTSRGYRRQSYPETLPLAEMEPGTFAFGRRFPVFDYANVVTVGAHAAIQPKRPGPTRFPILVSLKSAGAANERRRYDLATAQHARATYDRDIDFILLLCGKFDGGYLGRTAAELVDWVWEHRIEDFQALGV